MELEDEGVADEAGPAFGARRMRLAAILRDYLAWQQAHLPGHVAGAGAADGPAGAAMDEASPEQALRLLVWAAGLSSLVDGVGDADLSRVLADRLDMRAKGLLLAAGAEEVLAGLDDALLRAVRTGTSWRELEHLSTVARVVHVHPVVRSLSCELERFTLPLPVARGLMGNATVRHLVLESTQFEHPVLLRLLLRGLKGVESLKMTCLITAAKCSGLFKECLHLAPTLRELEIDVDCTPALAEGLAELLVRCRRLTSLRIDTLNIKGDGMAALARGIAGSASLRSLDLTVAAPPAAELPFAQAICDCSTLHSLKLLVNGHLLGDWTGSHLVSAIERCSHLQSLDVYWFGAPGARGSLVRAIQANHTIQRVKFKVPSDPLLAREHGVELLLTKGTAAEAITCTWAKFRGDALKDFAETLAVNTRLTGLGIQGMTADVLGLAHLATALERNTTLKTLGCGYLSGAVVPLAPLLSALRVNSSVTDLDVDVKRDTAALEALFAALEVNTTLRSVLIWASPPGPVCGLRLAAAIRSNSTLTSASFRAVAVTAGSADAIAEAVAVNSSLRSLSINLACHEVRSSLGAAAMRGAARNTTLTELSVGAVHAFEPAIHTVAALIESNSSITVLSLGNGWLAEPALPWLCRAMRCNSTLTKLDMCLSRLGSAEGVNRLAEAVRVHQRLRSLRLRAEEVPTADYASLDAALSESWHLADHWWRRRGLVLWLHGHR